MPLVRRFAGQWDRPVSLRKLAPFTAPWQSQEPGILTSADRVRTILNAPRGDRKRMPKAVDKGQRKSLAFGNSRRGGEWMGEGHDKIGPRDYLLPLVDACLRRMLYFHS